MTPLNLIMLRYWRRLYTNLYFKDITIHSSHYADTWVSSTVWSFGKSFVAPSKAISSQVLRVKNMILPQ